MRNVFMKYIVGIFVFFSINKFKHHERQNIPVTESDSDPCNVLFNVSLIHDNVISIFNGLNVLKTTQFYTPRVLLYIVRIKSEREKSQCQSYGNV